ncbi:MAG: endonuclease III [Chloroflexi bacterium]|nr:endonuclease III [Chloroflexota bacterium]
MDVRTIVERLEAVYGPKVWYRRNEPLRELIQTVLSQHTSDLNAERAFESLWRTFGSWEALAAADLDAIADAIRSGGLANQKAPRIKGILSHLYQERGAYDLWFLEELPVPEALAWLVRLPGVGPKTARCVLLFALGMPVIPVDTHVHRVSRRLGLIGPKTSAEEAHGVLEAMCLPQDAYRFHVCLIEHGRRICKALRPRCGVCPLSDGCPSATLGRHHLPQVIGPSRAPARGERGEP